MNVLEHISCADTYVRKISGNGIAIAYFDILIGILSNCPPYRLYPFMFTCMCAHFPYSSAQGYPTCSSLSTDRLKMVSCSFNLVSFFFLFNPPENTLINFRKRGRGMLIGCLLCLSQRGGTHNVGTCLTRNHTVTFQSMGQHSNQLSRTCQG